MKWLILLMLLCQAVGGYSYTLLSPEEVSFEAHQYELINDPYLRPVDKELKYGGVFTTDFAFIKIERWSFNSTNRLSFEQSQVTGKVRSGGWKFTLNLSCQLADHQHVEVGKYHHSYHIFEEARPDVHFPTADSYYIKFVIYRK